MQMTSLSGFREARPRLFAQLLAMLIALQASACVRHPEKSNAHEMLNATLWQQTSAEYIGSTLQVYRTARHNLDMALAEPDWTAALEQTNDYADLPPAVMLDIDETVLDNGPYEARIISSLGSYSPATFAEWCHQENAPLVPGARQFLDYAIQRDVAVFYYSSRREKLRGCTTRNMRELGLPLPGDTRLLLSNGASKSDYRKMVARQYRILLLVGDNMEDFAEGSKSDPASRRELARRHADRWGKQWMVLPNSIYGHWEASMYNFDYRLPREQQLDLKRQYLQAQ